MNMELIIRATTEVAETNIKTFEQQAQEYLAGINQHLQTDDDFAEAEANCKALKELESRTREEIANVASGNAEIETILDTAEQIAEQFRTTRLMLEKLVKSEKEARKRAIIDAQVEKIGQAYALDDNIRPMLAVTMPMRTLIERIEDAAKGKKGLAGIEKATSAEIKNIIVELAQEQSRLRERLKKIPTERDYLFRDAPDIVASDADIDAIIAERIAADDERKAAEQARIEAEAKAKAEAELAAQQAAEKATPEQPKEKPVKHEKTATQAAAQDVTDATAEGIGTYKIIIRCDIETAKNIARLVKEQHNDAFVALKTGV